MNNSEMKIMVPKGWIINEKLMNDGSRMLTIKPDKACYLQEGFFKKVPASELSLEDNFLKYVPKTEREKEFKKEIKKVIKDGVRDFWRPICDPSFYGDDICYKPGEMPAVGKSYEWWEEKAKCFCPERGSRLGTKQEYIAFLAVLIKEMISSGKAKKWAWNAVCNDSKELGHFGDSIDAKRDFEPTGSRGICGWYDLANTSKILGCEKGEYGMWTASGSYDDRFESRTYLFYLYHFNTGAGKWPRKSGWLVLDSWPED